MHAYLESIGFRRIKSHREMDQLTRETVLHYDEKNIFKNENGLLCGEFSKEFAPDMGLTCCGEFDDGGSFRPSYTFPYYKGETLSLRQDIEFERHTGDESYAGACEDPRIGATLIFYLDNLAQYRNKYPARQRSPRHYSVRLSALAKEGTVLLPVFQEREDIEKNAIQRKAHYKLISEARGGNEDAIEELTAQDMEDYSVISKRTVKEDVFSIVDTCFLPYGVECDQYSLLGNIMTCDRVKNEFTGEYVYQMEIEVCDVHLDLCINESSLEGMPCAGRRFRGLIWLQGMVNFGK